MVQNESENYPYSVSDFSSKDAIVIAPHPDDESLGCGGSIIRHIKTGSKVRVIFLTNGDKGDFEERFGKDYLGVRRESTERAMEILGVNDYQFWNYKDRDVYLVESEIKDRLSIEIETFSPSLIYAPSPLEAHPDHKAAFEVVWALKEKPGISLAFYEILMALYPNVLVDITDQIEQKKKAIESYVTEVYYNDYITKVEGLNRFRTATLKKDIKFAEAFFLLDDARADKSETLAFKIFTAAAQYP